MRKFIFNGMNIGYTAPDRAQDVSYNNTESGLSASTTQTAIDELTTVVNGKVDKEEGKGLFSGSYNDLTDKPGITSKTSAGFCPQLPNETTTTKYLRQDGSWQVPPDNNTTYSAGSNITLSGTTFSLTKANVTGALGYTPPTTNTTYSAGSNITLSGTTFSLTKANVTGALGYTPPTTNTTYSAGSNITLSGTTFSLTKANVTGALGYTPPTSDTNNAVTCEHSNSNSQYPICWSGRNNTTSYTEKIYKCTAFRINPYETRLYVAHTSNGTFTQIYSTGILLAGDTASRIYHNGTQDFILQATNESNYGVRIGVKDSTWAFMPKERDYMRLGTSTYRWNQIYSSNTAISTSDRNLKKDIESLDESAKEFMMKLNPVSFKMKEGDSGRTHYGLIAQDVEDTMTELGMTGLDFAGFCKDQKMEDYEVQQTNEKGELLFDHDNKPIMETKQRPIEGEYIYSLRYEEFISPILKTVQLQQKELEEKDKRINDLEERLSKLEQLIKDK